METLDGVITIAEAAAIHQKDRTVILRHIHQGRLTPVGKLPGRTGSWLLSREEVLNLANHTKGE